MEFSQWFIDKHPGISIPSAEAVIALASEGATVPFMARYRKERTGNLDEVQIQKTLDAKEEWDNLLKRQKFIVSEIDKQGKLNPELTKTIFSTFRMEALEDIYLPYKLKKKTKAVMAREAGLEPLADIIWDLGHGVGELSSGVTLEALAQPFVLTEKGVKDTAAALQGVQDIFTERLSENKDLREEVRQAVFSHGFVVARKTDKAKANSKYENYFSYFEDLKSLMQGKNSHRYLALRRGWLEEELAVSIGAPDEERGAWLLQLEDKFRLTALTKEDSLGADILKKAAKLAFKAYVYPSIENEVHKGLKEVADHAAIDVFAENVKNLLLASPFGAKTVLGVDPGIRTGCKIALVDESGAFKVDTVVHLQSEKEKEQAALLFEKVIKEANPRAIAVGNGTAGRETEIFIRDTLKKLGSSVPVVMVNEAGASVYSASEVAREEFPNLDITVRGAISIARRLQDPLAELVKIDPKSIGVGQYQHDVAPALLKKSLDNTVDSCVNRVGVNLNTASIHLLAHVSGIGPGLAKAIMEHRAEKGLFKSRDDLLKVSRFSKKTFEQAAGFLRIPSAETPLDNTGVHPERYAFIEALAEFLGKTSKELLGPEGAKVIRARDSELKKFKEEVGEFTFADIVAELEKPGRDPREEFIPFTFRDDIFEIKDLKPGMQCPGIVTNVANFGAFVDIGVHQDGLVHISQISDRFVKDPREVVKPGDRVTVRVLEVNFEKKQISLSMKKDAAEVKAAHEAALAEWERKRAAQGPAPGRAAAGARPSFEGGAPGGRRDEARRDNRGPRRDEGPRRDNRDFRGGGGGGGRGQSAPKTSHQQSLSSNPFEKLAALKNQLGKK